MWERPTRPKRPEEIKMGYQPVKRIKKEKSRWLSLQELWRDILIWWNWRISR